MSYNILVVDKLGATRIELSNFFKQHHVHVVGAKDEIEAMNLLHGNKFDIKTVIWVVNSVGFEDFDAIEAIKKKEAYHHIPIMIISKYTEKKYIIKAIEVGAVEYMSKPYDESALFSKLQTILGVKPEKSSFSSRIDDIITFTFSEMISREVKAASRGGYPMAMLLGSLVPKAPGQAKQPDPDEVISTINKVLKVRLRETDISFHYAANSLILLLPFTDKSGVEKVEKKIQNIFSSHSMVKEKGKEFFLVVTSVSLPEDGKIKDKLLEKLEKNLRERVKQINGNKE